MRATLWTIIFFLGTTSSLFALTSVDVTPRATELLKAGCRPVSKRIAVSPGTAEMFRYEFKTPLPATRAKFAVSAACKEGTATAYFFEYSSNKKARKAFIFGRSKIWEGYSRTAEKPERLYLFNNYFIVVSSPDAPHGLDQLIVKKIALAPIDDETIRKMMKRLKCGQGSAFYETCKALRLFRGSVSTNFRINGYRMGRVREFGPRGGTRILHLIGYVSEGGSPRSGYISPINPENEDEKKQLRELHANLKTGTPVTISAGLRKFLTDTRAKMSRPVRSMDTFHIMEGIRFIFHVRNVRGKFVVIATSEHITGIPSGMIVGILRPLK